MRPTTTNPVLILLLPLSLLAQVSVATIPETDAVTARLELLGPEINSAYVEYTPFVTPDEKLMIFESDRPGGVGRTGDFDLWLSRNTASPGEPTRFSVPENLGEPVNSEEFDGLPSLRILPTGETEIYFTSYASTRRPGPRDTNIYYSRNSGSGWSRPVPLLEINSDFHDRNPSISSDGRFLYFSSDRPGGIGKDDIWVSEYSPRTSRWGAPQNLGSTINSPASETSPSIHVDGITVYFSSDRRGGVGGFDIYVTQRFSEVITPGGWKTPQNLGKPYNSPQDEEYPTVLQSGRVMYFTSNRGGGAGSYDIYRAAVPEFAKPMVVITIAGRVREEIADKSIEANIRIEGDDGIRNISTGLSNGNYSATLINDRKYRILVTAPGYEPVEYLLDLNDNHTAETIRRDFYLCRPESLPAEVALRIRFRTQSGVALQPNATWRLAPSMPNEQILGYEDNNYGLIKLTTGSDNIENFISSLSALSLEVKASQTGFDQISRTWKLREVIVPENRKVRRNYDLEVTMIQSGEINFNGKTAKVLYNNDNSIRVHFAHNIGDRVLESDLDDLNGVRPRWEKAGKPSIRLEGHTDSTGTRERNNELSRERSMLVKKILEKSGIPSEKITATWYGPDRPRVPEKDDASRAENRRVEILFEPTK